MPFCPSCRYEYRTDITKCPDCGESLVESLAPEPESELVDLVRIASYPFEGLAQVALLKLHSVGIQAVINNEKIAQTDMILAFADGGVHILVDKDDAVRAREVLESKTDMSDFQPKFLHCRIRVRDIARSMKFYTDMFGFVKVRENTSPAGNQLAYLELPGNNTQIELCYQPDTPDFILPEDIFHFAFSVPDLHAYRARWEPEGIEFWPESGPVNDAFYFISDPDGYEIEVMKVG